MQQALSTSKTQADARARRILHASALSHASYRPQRPSKKQKKSTRRVNRVFDMSNIIIAATGINKATIDHFIHYSCCCLGSLVPFLRLVVIVVPRVSLRNDNNIWKFDRVIAPLLTKLLLVKMIIPVRCFTCGKVIGNKWETYLSLLQADFSEGWVLCKANKCCFVTLAVCYIVRTTQWTKYSCIRGMPARSVRVCTLPKSSIFVVKLQDWLPRSLTNSSCSFRYQNLSFVSPNAQYQACNWRWHLVFRFLMLLLGWWLNLSFSYACLSFFIRTYIVTHWMSSAWNDTVADEWCWRTWIWLKSC